MGDAVATNFTAEDRISIFRKAADSNKDGVVTQDEVSLDATQAQPARNALNGVTLPGTTGAKVNDSTTTADVSSGLGQGTGVVSNRSLFSIPNSPNHVQSSEMNIGDASNYTRLRAAGLTEGQLNNPNNIFVHLGQDSSGKEQYGFYSKGFGEGDERTGVVSVEEDGNISSSLGAGWSPASEEQKQVLNDAYKAREQLIKDKFGGKFEDYSKFEKARSQVDDLLARGDIGGEVRNQLADLKKKMDPSDSGFDHTRVTSEATTLLEQHSTELTDIQMKEAEGKVDNPNDSKTEADLDTKLKDQTNKVNALDDKGKTEFITEYNKLKDKLENLQSSNDEKVKAFKKASDYLKSVTKPDKTSLAELKWQNARFDKMMKEDNNFQAEVEKNKPQSPNPSTPPEPPTPPDPSAPPEPSTPPETPTPPNPSTPPETPTPPDPSAPPETPAPLDEKKENTNISNIGHIITSSSTVGDNYLTRSGDDLFIANTEHGFYSKQGEENSKYIKFNDRMVKIENLPSPLRNVNFVKASEGDFYFAPDNNGEFKLMEKEAEGPLKGTFKYTSPNGTNYNLIEDKNRLFPTTITPEGKVRNGLPANDNDYFDYEGRRYFYDAYGHVLESGSYTRSQGMNLTAFEANTLADTQHKVPDKVREYQRLHNQMVGFRSKYETEENIKLTRQYFDIISDHSLDINKLDAFKSYLDRLKNK